MKRLFLVLTCALSASTATLTMEVAIDKTKADVAAEANKAVNHEHAQLQKQLNELNRDIRSQLPGTEKITKIISAMLIGMQLYADKPELLDRNLQRLTQKALSINNNDSEKTQNELLGLGFVEKKADDQKIEFPMYLEFKNKQQRIANNMKLHALQDTEYKRHQQEFDQKKQNADTLKNKAEAIKKIIMQHDKQYIELMGEHKLAQDQVEQASVVVAKLSAGLQQIQEANKVLEGKKLLLQDSLTKKIAKREAQLKTLKEQEVQQTDKLTEMTNQDKTFTDRRAMQDKIIHTKNQIIELERLQKHDESELIKINNKLEIEKNGRWMSYIPSLPSLTFWSSK